MIVSAEGVIKVRNIMPTAGIELTSLAFLASVLTITPPRFPVGTTMPMPPWLYSFLPERSVQTSTVGFD